MSFRDTEPPSRAMEQFMQRINDFMAAVENGDYMAGALTLDAPLTIGNVTIDTPHNPDTGQVDITLTNVQSGNTITLVSIP